MRSCGALLAAACALFAATGCYKTTLGEPRAPANGAEDVWLHQFVFGLAGAPQIDVRNSCESGATRVSVFESGATFAATVFTLGVYTPRIARVTCAAPRRAR